MANEEPYLYIAGERKDVDCGRWIWSKNWSSLQLGCSLVMDVPEYLDHDTSCDDQRHLRSGQSPWPSAKRKHHPWVLDLAKASSETSEEEVEVKHVSIQPRRGQWLCKKKPAMAQNDAPHLKLFYIYIYIWILYIQYVYIYILIICYLSQNIPQWFQSMYSIVNLYHGEKRGFWLPDLTRPQASEVVELQVEDEAPAKTGLFSHFQQEWRYI